MDISDYSRIFSVLGIILGRAYHLNNPLNGNGVVLNCLDVGRDTFGQTRDICPLIRIPTRSTAAHRSVVSCSPVLVTATGLRHNEYWK